VPANDGSLHTYKSQPFNVARFSTTPLKGDLMMLDHVFLSVSDLNRSVAFYVDALSPLGITQRHDFDGKDGPPGHPDLKGFGTGGRIGLWLRSGVVEGRAAHVGFLARSEVEVNAAYAAAMAAGATDNGAPGVRLYYDPRYYAANVMDPDGYSLEFVYKSWQHRS
jgi:catechol 2,3-dioxygenase-like lactoylglutathione lyase family enzyme